MDVWIGVGADHADDFGLLRWDFRREEPGCAGGGVPVRPLLTAEAVCPPPFRGRRVGTGIRADGKSRCRRRGPPSPRFALPPPAARWEGQTPTQRGVRLRPSAPKSSPRGVLPPTAQRGEGRGGGPPAAAPHPVSADDALPPHGVVPPPVCFGGGTGAWCAPGWGPATAPRRSPPHPPPIPRYRLRW